MGGRSAARVPTELRGLIQRCPTPVLVVSGLPSSLRRLLLAYNGSLKAREALFVAAYLALRGGGELAVVVVREEGIDHPAVLSEARSYLEGSGVSAAYLEENGPVAQAILSAAAAQRSDLILMGGYHHGPVLDFFLGSAVDEVLGASQQPVLLCR